MCNKEKYTEIFHEIEKLTPDDTLQLIPESNSEEEKDFFEMIGDYLLQKRQEKVIEGNSRVGNSRFSHAEHTFF